MKIAIIGYGFVGQALHSVLKRSSTPGPLILDPALDHTFIGGVDGLLLNEPDIIFLCLPTPTVDGKCDDSLIIEHAEKLKDWAGCLVIKSTVPPSTVEHILKIRPSTVIWPELLREAQASRDMQWPSVIVVGAPTKMHFNFIVKFIKEHTEIHWNKAPYPHENSKIRHVKPVEASIFKYTVNSFLATKTVFFHQMQRWMETSGRGESYDVVTKLLVEEGRIGQTHMQAPGEHGYGYAGSCFPKDVEALLDQVYHEDVTSFPLLNEVNVQNKQLRAV